MGNQGQAPHSVKLRDILADSARPHRPAYSQQPPACSLRRAIKASVDSRLSIADWPRLRRELASSWSIVFSP